MSETFKLFTASVTIRREEETYTRADGTTGISLPGVTIKTADGGYIKLGWIDAELLKKCLTQQTECISDGASKEIEAVADSLLR